MQSISVSVRDAKINLSKLLKMVQKDSEIILTDRGRPVAKIVPIKTEYLTLHVRINRLEEQSVIEPPGKGHKRIPPPIPILNGMAQRLLEEYR